MRRLDPVPALRDGPPEPEWPARAIALDAERMAPRLAEALRIRPERAAGARPEARLLKETGGRRCVIRYRLGRALAIGKLYRDPARGERSHRRLLALRESLGTAAASCVPEPLGWLPELGLLLQEWRGDGDLRDALAAGEAIRAGERAAGWLAALHAAEPLAGLKRRTLAYEVARLARFADALAGRSDGSASALREAREGLSAAAAKLPAYGLAMIHKDFYYAHVLWDGAGLSILDFDELSLGDPAFDVGHFLAHLERLAQRLPAQTGILAAVGQSFLRAYPAPQSAGFRARVAFYRGWAALKLAATEARRGEPGWERRAEGLLARAALHAGSSARGGA
jgi:aminoglycoside phosphotransferase (APT) family kinase protein